MKILFIGPLPDPITGHSLASKIFLEELEKGHDVDVVNLSKKSFKDGMNSAERIVEVMGILCQIWKKRNSHDVIYLTISESLAGNLKDILTYLMCFKSLSRMIVHLHGGTLKKMIFDRHKLLFTINKFFISRLGGVIILGPSHIQIFKGLITDSKIHIVPNFSEDYLFSTEEEILRKFSRMSPLKILFLSNFILEKGFNDIIDAYVKLGDDLKKNIQIDFAGAFESDVHKEKFLNKINRISQIRYHGIVEGSKKKELLSHSHVFCLPSALNEGQPISILEAYASGCAVVTTDRGGIPDVFQDGVNGFEVEARSATSLQQVFSRCLQESRMLSAMALVNFKSARRMYRTSNYTASLMNVIRGFSGDVAVV